MNGRRLAMVEVSNHFIIEMMTKGFEVVGLKCIEGIPDGAVYSHSFTDEYKACTYFVFQHESFKEVERGAVIPIIDVALQSATWREGQDDASH